MEQRWIAHTRLVSQLVARPLGGPPEQVVAHHLAMQAQDYLGSLWGVGARTLAATEADVERAVASGAIVRTWPMRGTIHMLASGDVRWMLELLAPRSRQKGETRRRQLGLDPDTLARSAEAVVRELEGGRQRTRPQLYAAIEAAGVPVDTQRGMHILGWMAHERVVCIGPRAGKQPTFALLDEWVPPSAPLPREEGLARLARRYVAGHAPATAQDLAWWAGLPLGEARAALRAAGGDLEAAEVDGQTYYRIAGAPPPEVDPGEAFLLPPFDEYLIAYRDRGASLAPQHAGLVAPGSNGIFHPIVVIDGRVVGTWRRTIGRRDVAVSFARFEGEWSPAEREALARAAERYGAFLGMPAKVG